MGEGKKVLELVTAPKHVVDPELVGVMRMLLEKAESGELRGIAAALDVGNGRASHVLAVSDGASRGGLTLGLGLLRRQIEDACIAELKGA